MKRFKSLNLINYGERRVLRFVAVFAVLLALPFGAWAEEKSDSLFRGIVYFHKSSAAVERNYSSNRAALDSIVEFLRSARGMAPVNVEVYGSSSPEGKAGFNRRLARRRASSLLDVLAQYMDSLVTVRSVESGIAPNLGRTRWPRQRYASIRISYPRPVAAVVAEVATADGVPGADRELTAEPDTVIVVDASSAYDDNSLIGGGITRICPGRLRNFLVS